MNVWPVIAFLVLLVLRLWGPGLLPHSAPKTYLDTFVHATTIGLVLAVAVFIDRLVRHFYWRGHLERRRNRPAPALIQDIFSVSLLLLALAFGFWWQAGLTITGIAAASGAVAFVLGIALQPVIQDLFSGLSINFDGSYSLGEWLTVYCEHLPQPVHGRVTGINWRTTFLTLEDGTRMMIPNRTITSNPVTNHSRAPAAKELSVEIPVEIRLPGDHARDILLGEAFKAVRHAGLARMPEPRLLVKALTGDAVIYDLRFHYHPDQITPGSARSVMQQALHDAIQQHALALPVTQIEMTQPPVLEPELKVGDIKDALCSVRLFRDALDEAQFLELAARCRPVTFAKGDILMRQGDPPGSMFLLIQGAASVSLLTQDGNAREVAVSAMGDVAGEMSLMTGANRTATVVALTRLKALEITKEAISDLLHGTPELYQRFSAILALRQHELDAAQRHPDKVTVQTDILSRMKSFFSRSFGGGEA